MYSFSHRNVQKTPVVWKVSKKLWDVGGKRCAEVAASEERAYIDFWRESRKFPERVENMLEKAYDSRNKHMERNFEKWEKEI